MCAATRADYERVDVAASLAGVEQDCFTFSGVLDAKGRELANAGDAPGAELLSLLCGSRLFGPGSHWCVLAPI